MTFKMWAEFQEALGTIFGLSWGVVIATVVFDLPVQQEREGLRNVLRRHCSNVREQGSNGGR